MASGKRRRRLTARQRKLMNFLAEHPDATLEEAGRFAGYGEVNPASARTGASKALRSKSVQETIADLMEQDPELNNHAFLERLKDGLRAKKKTYAIHEGVFTDEREDDDLVTRKHYLELGAKMKGALVHKAEVNGGDKPLKTLDLSHLDPAQLVKLIEGTL